MEFSRGEAALILGAFLAPLVAAIIATATERTHQTIGRGRFFEWVIIIYVIVPLIVKFVSTPTQPWAIPPGMPEFLGVLGLLVAVFVYFYQQRVVRRARDAGHDKWLAYVAIVPIIGALVTVYLLFKRSA